MTSDLLEKERLPAEDDMRQYLSEIRRYPLLNPEEERALAQRCAQGDEDALRRMVNSNLRLVVSVAREYTGRGVPLLDLIQEGSIGLLIAAKKFDYTLDFRFSTYATKWIRQRISKCLSGKGTIRVPTHTLDKIRKLLAVRGEWMQQHGGEPTLEQLAEVSGLPASRVQQLLQLSPEVCSLDAPVGEEDSSLGQLIENTQDPQPYENLVREELNEILNQLLQDLEPRQRQIIRLHYGLEDGQRHSLSEIAQMLGVSKERARQIEKRAMEKLHTRGSAIGLEDFLQ